jgi:hypothetical protein
MGLYWLSKINTKLSSLILIASIRSTMTIWLKQLQIGLKKWLMNTLDYPRLSIPKERSE